MAEKQQQKSSLPVTLKWTDELVLKLIYLWRQKETVSAETDESPRIFWNGIINDLGVHESITWAQARKKWSNMVNKYKTIRGVIKAADTDEAKETNDNWPFFVEMEDALKHSTQESASIKSYLEHPFNSIWTYENTLSMVHLRVAKESQITEQGPRLRKVWIEIVKELGLQECVSWEQAKRRWNYLVIKFTILKNRPSWMTEDLCWQIGDQWPLFGQMQVIFQDSMLSESIMCLPCLWPTPMNVSWTEDMIFKLIELRADRKQYFTGHKNSAKIAWSNIIKELGVEDAVSWKQARKKWNNLVTKFKLLRKGESKTASESHETWPFYSYMERALFQPSAPVVPCTINRRFPRLPQNHMSYRKNSAKKRANFVDVMDAAVEDSNNSICQLSCLIANPAWARLSVMDNCPKPVMNKWTDEMAVRLLKLWEDRVMATKRQGGSHANVWTDVIKELGLEKTPSWELAKRKRYSITPNQLNPELNTANECNNWQWYSQTTSGPVVTDQSLAAGTSSSMDAANVNESVIKIRKNDIDSILLTIEESQEEIKQLKETMKQQGDMMCTTLQTLIQKVNSY